MIGIAIIRLSVPRLIKELEVLQVQLQGLIQNWHHLDDNLPVMNVLF